MNIWKNIIKAYFKTFNIIRFYILNPDEGERKVQYNYENNWLSMKCKVTFHFK